MVSVKRVFQPNSSSAHLPQNSDPRTWRLPALIFKNSNSDTQVQLEARQAFSIKKFGLQIRARYTFGSLTWSSPNF